MLRIWARRRPKHTLSQTSPGVCVLYMKYVSIKSDIKSVTFWFAPKTYCAYRIVKRRVNETLNYHTDLKKVKKVNKSYQ